MVGEADKVVILVIRVGVNLQIPRNHLIKHHKILLILKLILLGELLQQFYYNVLDFLWVWSFRVKQVDVNQDNGCPSVVQRSILYPIQHL